MVASTELETQEAVRKYLDSLKPADLNQYDLRRLVHDVQQDLNILKDLYDRTEPLAKKLAKKDAKLATLKDLLAGPLKGNKVLIFTSFKDTARYLHWALTEADPDWLAAAGGPHIRRIDSGNHPPERTEIVKAFSPVSMGGPPANVAPIDVLASTDVLSEGQNLRDCGVMVNYDLTWNPIRLVQRSGRVDRLRSKHETVSIWNMFPEKELERLLELVARLTDRIAQIDDPGFLDASVLGEVVHPRTFNVLRRIGDGDTSVLDEEEARAEPAGPEVLPQQLRETLNKEGVAGVVDLPDGIHSGLRKPKAYGMSFYFKAPRPGGKDGGGGWRHFWRYIDAATHEVTDNRFQIAQMIRCRPDEARVIGDQDVYDLQERVIRDVLKGEETAAAKAAMSPALDKAQLGLAEAVKAAARAGGVDRERAKAGLKFLNQPAGKAALAKLKEAHKAYGRPGDEADLVDAVAALAKEYHKGPAADPAGATAVTRDDLQLVCFDYLAQ